VTPAAIWIWLRGDDRGELLQRARRIEQFLAPTFRLAETLDAFVHDGGRDLSGYEDGTENPAGDAATTAAIIGADRPLLTGSSFVALQRWLHDLALFEQMPPDDRDLCIGRRRRDNEEIADALFRFTRPQSGAYFWCPAMRAGRLDLSPLRL